MPHSRRRCCASWLSRWSANSRTSSPSICLTVDLTTVKQYDCYTEVMAVIRKVGLNVVAISVDNASTNRKFFIDFLCRRALTTSIIDSDSGQPIFLIFDSVHDLKNVYNNFQAKKCSAVPRLIRTCQTDAALTSTTSLTCITWKHLRRWRKRISCRQQRSMQRASKKLPWLSPRQFLPSQRAMLWRITPTIVTDRSGAVQLSSSRWYSSFGTSWTSSRRARGSIKGTTPCIDPARSSQNWKLCFLRELAEFLQRWEAAGKDGCTPETFLALRHTCLALADCAAYLLDHLGFKFVLLGQLQSDALESRFGWLRQLSGANYYISMRQVLESDRKIRALSLLRFSKMSLSDIEDAVHADCSSATSTSDGDNTADVIADSLRLDAEPSESAKHIIFYVSGAIARSTVACTECNQCKEALVCSSQLPVIYVKEKLDDRAAEFLDCINRGGLIRPSDFTYKLVRHCWRVFDELWNRPDLKSTFLLSPGQRLPFCKIMDRVCTWRSIWTCCLDAACVRRDTTCRFTSSEGSSTAWLRTSSSRSLPQLTSSAVRWRRSAKSQSLPAACTKSTSLLIKVNCVAAAAAA